MWRNKNKWPRTWAIILISGLFFTCNILTAQADSYIRVYKNGVIYYYFSQRGESSNNPLDNTYGRSRVVPPRVRNKVLPQVLEPVIQEASRSHNLPPSLVKAVIKVESNFNAAATSPKGAQGLMQLMPSTAEELQVTDPYDIRENIWAGCRYLNLLLQKFNNRLPLALAAYNAGPKRVERHQDIPPIKETQYFVNDVCTNFVKYSNETSYKTLSK